MTPLPNPSSAPDPHAAPDDGVPADIKLDLQAQSMTILWKDGLQQTHALGRLRGVCPCATCRQRRSAPRETGSLPILNLPAGGVPVVTDARLVGHYAINLRWSDGHDTGIYEYRFLRRLDAADA